MTPNEVFTSLCDKLEDQPDGYCIGIGDFRSCLPGDTMPLFNAIIKLDLGEIRKMVEWKKKSGV